MGSPIREPTRRIIPVRDLYFTVGDTRFALIACTFATNYGINHINLEGCCSGCVNMCHPITGGGAIYRPLPVAYWDTLRYVEGLLGRKLAWEESTRLKRAMQMPRESVDAFVPEEDLEKCFQRIESDYREARKQADIVLFYPHSGGQFNIEPGAYTKHLVKKAVDVGFDGVFASHAHTTQRAEFIKGKPCFYSLGNVSMSPGTFYSVPECLPEYGLAVHLYTKDKKIAKVTFSVFKMVLREGNAMQIIPADTLYTQLDRDEQRVLAAEVAQIVTRVTGRPAEPTPPAQEYPLHAYL